MKTPTSFICFLGLLVLTIIPTVYSGPSNMLETDDSIELERQTWNYLAAYTAHDVDKIVTFFCEDAERIDVNGKVTKYTNTKDIRLFAENIFKEFPDFRTEVQDVFAKGNRVCARYIITGTASGEGLVGKSAAGKRISVPAVTILEWKDGKIFRSYDFRNVAMVMMQLEFLPAPQQDQQNE